MCTTYIPVIPVIYLLYYSGDKKNIHFLHFVNLTLLPTGSYMKSDKSSMAMCYLITIFGIILYNHGTLSIIYYSTYIIYLINYLGIYTY